jgi:pantothenate kinase
MRTVRKLASQVRSSSFRSAFAAPTDARLYGVPLTFDDLLRRARDLTHGGRRALLGIAGSPGAGKTTLAVRLVRALNSAGDPWVAHVPMDGFHLADAELDRLGLRDRKGAPETFDAAGYAALLRRLRDGDGDGTDDIVYAPGFERVLEQPLAGALPVPPSARLVVTEGNYLLLDTGAWRRVRAALDEVWFCELPEPERLRRLIARHEEFGKRHEEAVAWVTRSDQRNAELIEATRDRADLLLPMAALEGGTGG